jgi:K+-sensing histidine kinase KdpD
MSVITRNAGRARKIFKRCGFRCYTHLSIRGCCTNILEYQREHDIQLIVLGAFSHSKIHQFFLGSITTTIFRNANVPLLVAK